MNRRSAPFSPSPSRSPGSALAATLAPAARRSRRTIPITAEQRATAQTGRPGRRAPGRARARRARLYTVKRGDTLWGISGVFLQHPWRWPELWGMNLDQIRNPHLIYPGQMLVLEKSDGRARLRLAHGGRRAAP